MLNTRGKKAKPICTSAWQFPNFAKLFPVYSSRTVREARVDEILSNLEERYSVNSTPQSMIVDQIPDTAVVSNGRDPTTFPEMKELEAVTACDTSQELGTVKEQISESELEELERKLEESESQAEESESQAEESESQAQESESKLEESESQAEESESKLEESESQAEESESQVQESESKLEESESQVEESESKLEESEIQAEESESPSQESESKLEEVRNRRVNWRSKPESQAEESESSVPINVFEKKYFKKWHKSTSRKVDEKTANLKKNVFGKNIYEQVDLEEELWKKWKQTEIEMNEMKAILLLHWTPDTDIDYSFQHARYLTEYKRNPFKWTDSKYSESSQGLEVKAIRRWIRIEEMHGQLKERFLGKYESLLQDKTGESADLFFIQKQRKYLHQIIDIKRNRY